MDILSDANAYMPYMLGAFILLVPGIVWTGTNYEYWEWWAVVNQNRPSFEFSYRRARRLADGWCIALLVIFAVAMIIAGYGIYLGLTRPPVVLVYQ